MAPCHGPRPSQPSARANTRLGNRRGGSPQSPPEVLTACFSWISRGDRRRFVTQCQAPAVTRDRPGVPHSRYLQRRPTTSRLARKDHAPHGRRALEMLPAGVGPAVGRRQREHLVPRHRPADALDHQALLAVGQDAERDRPAVPVAAAVDAAAGCAGRCTSYAPVQRRAAAASRKTTRPKRIICTGPLRRGPPAEDTSCPRGATRANSSAPSAAGRR